MPPRILRFVPTNTQQRVIQLHHRKRKGFESLVQEFQKSVLYIQPRISIVHPSLPIDSLQIDFSSNNFFLSPKPIDFNNHRLIKLNFLPEYLENQSPRKKTAPNDILNAYSIEIGKGIIGKFPPSLPFPREGISIDHGS